MFTTELYEIYIRVGEWALTRPLTWEDNLGPIKRTITVPKGFITDHASLPKFLRPLLTDTGESKRPFVLHDWLYCFSKKGVITRKQADELLRAAMIADGHGKLKALVYYIGVRIGGHPYWTKKTLEGLTREDILV